MISKKSKSKSKSKTKSKKWSDTYKKSINCKSPKVFHNDNIASMVEKK